MIWNSKFLISSTTWHRERYWRDAKTWNICYSQIVISIFQILTSNSEFGSWIIHAFSNTNSYWFRTGFQRWFVCCRRIVFKFETIEAQFRSWNIDFVWTSRFYAKVLHSIVFFSHLFKTTHSHIIFFNNEGLVFIYNDPDGNCSVKYRFNGVESTACFISIFSISLSKSRKIGNSTMFFSCFKICTAFLSIGYSCNGYFSIFYSYNFTRFVSFTYS